MLKCSVAQKPPQKRFGPMLMNSNIKAKRLCPKDAESAWATVAFQLKGVAKTLWSSAAIDIARIGKSAFTG
jgi:hypothetical protein